MSGKLVVLSGPSGVGKDTLIETWIRRNPRVIRVVTYTTRPPREGEANGVDYNFVSAERFQALADAGVFFEFKNVHGNWYASPKADAEKYLAEQRIVVLKIDVQGALALMESRADVLSVFVLPPSLEELERRLRTRGSESEESIQRRLSNAREEIAQADRYQFRVVNEGVEEAAIELDRLVQ